MVLSERGIKDKLASFRGWELVDGKLEKLYRLPDFMPAIDFINKVAVVAESLDHHPDIRLHYNQLTFSVYTHSENGITDKDFQLIKEIEKLSIETL